MTPGITTGLDHALWLLGYAIGLAPLYVTIGLVIGTSVPAAQWLAHRSRVARTRRTTRRSGRAPHQHLDNWPVAS